MVIRSRIDLLTSKDDVDLLADEVVDARHRAHFDAGDADGRSRLEARDVVEARLQVVALPEKPAAAGQHEDGHGRDRDRDESSARRFSARTRQAIVCVA